LRPERVLCPAGDGHMIVTSGGAAAWSELVLYLSARFAGRARAVHAAKVFLLGDHSDGQLPFSAMIRPHHHEDLVIDRCQSWIAENYAVSTPVERMIEYSRLSPRTFKRRFRAATGYTPLDYVQLLRIEEAKQLLETTNLAIDSVCSEVGYEEPAFFRRLFRRYADITPSRYRQRFRILAY
jgi:transcriptional regulator GlxA family with amidase domain